MKPSKKIQQLKKDLRELFGDDAAAVKAVEIQERYIKIGQEHERLRNCGYTYKEAIDRTCQVFHCSEGTARRSAKKYATFKTLSVTK